MSRFYHFPDKCLVFDSKLLEAPKTLKHFVYQYKEKKQILDKKENNANKLSKHSFFDNYSMDVFLFIAAILSMIATAAITHILMETCKTESLTNRHCISANKRNRCYIW